MVLCSKKWLILRRIVQQSTSKVLTKCISEMAKFSGILASQLSGKLGKVVYYTMRGKNCVRSLPRKSEVKPSPEQVLNRQRFMKMTKFCRQFKFVVIPQIWNVAAKGMTGTNYFIKTNKVAFDLEGKITDPKLIKLSVGKLLLPSEIQVQRHEAGSSLIDVSWIENNYHGGIDYWDELLVISCGEGLYSMIKNTGIKRGELKGSFELPELKTVTTHVYLFFESLDKNKYTESICFELDAN